MGNINNNNINDRETNDVISIENYNMITEVSEETFHDLKNLLATISGLTQLTMLKNQSEEIMTYLSSIIEATSDFTRVLNNYYDCTIGDHKQKEAYVLYEIIDNAIVLVKHKIRSFDMIKKSLCLNLDIQSLSKVFGYKYKLKQCFLNILINAIDSMEERGGTLTVMVYNNSSDTYVNVDIIDTGSGISEENIERLFKERFTTKCNGTGLGLKIAKNVVENHGGSLKITSKVNQGTKVHISLPIYNDCELE
ncbi:MAG: HAMP domain-containing sensor histidine kinase [Tissierellia bacterium]|nr:HAMP domain-containing sensor histidine kinase [Tissierellia bacterium]MDD4725815.1 HAMP domain-containing sensor histidine kinase [Tissierellia bacterium]